MKAWKILTPSGALILTIGIVIVAINSLTLDLILKTNMVLTPTSKSYPMWKDLPVPLTASFYLFHISNAEDVYNIGAKPMLVEKGPYVFQEFHHKIDEVWNDNGTVTYKQIKRWIHVSGDIEENVTIVNSVYATVGAQVAVLPRLERILANMGLAFLHDEKLFLTKPVREILFDGYTDPILSLGDEISKIGIHLPGLTSRFGLFFGRNNTWYSDGIMNIQTGANGMNHLGQITSLNYSVSTPAFKGECGKYRGSPELFPPHFDGKSKQMVFNPDLCRTLELTPNGEKEKVGGTEGSVYEVDETFFANSSINPDNQCFGTSEIPSGMFNASACRFGAPIFMSQPHFYQTDPYYNTLLASPLKPNKTLHETKFVFETVSGVPMKVAARFQVNIKLERIDELHAFKNLPKITYLPFVWFDTSMEMPAKLTSQMWYLSNLKIILITMGSVFIGVGFGLFVYGYFNWCSSAKDYSQVQVDSTIETAETEEIHSDTNNHLDSEDH